MIYPTGLWHNPITLLRIRLLTNRLVRLKFSKLDQNRMQAFEDQTCKLSRNLQVWYELIKV
jgi:hypothetical protein